MAMARLTMVWLAMVRLAMVQLASRREAGCGEASRLVVQVCRYMAGTWHIAGT